MYKMKYAYLLFYKSRWMNYSASWFRTYKQVKVSRSESVAIHLPE